MDCFHQKGKSVFGCSSFVFRQFKSRKRRYFLVPLFEILKLHFRIRPEEEKAEPQKEAIKTFEKQNKLQDRRKERERRMTQEISLLKPSPSLIDEQNVQYTPGALPHPRRGTEPVSREALAAAAAASAQVTGEGLKKKTGSSSLLATEELTPVPMQRMSSTRRTPVFSTRKNVFKNLKQSRDDFGNIDMHGNLDRKHDLQVVVFLFAIVYFFFVCFVFIVLFLFQIVGQNRKFWC